MKSVNFSSIIFDDYNPDKDSVSDNYKDKTASQKLLVNKKGLLRLESEIAQKMAEEFCDHLRTDPEFRLIFDIKPRFLNKADSIIKTLFIKNAAKVFSEDETLLNQIVYDCLNQGIFKKYNKLVEKNQELEQIERLDSSTLVDLETTKQENRQLKEKVAELEEALTLAQTNLGLNSSNSNLPPSTDFYPPKTDLDFEEDSEEEDASSEEASEEKKEVSDEKEASSEQHSDKKKRKDISNTRKKTGRRQGAQSGHPGRTLTKERINELLESGVKKEIINIGNIEDGNYKSGWLLDLNIEPVIKEVRVPVNENFPDELSGGPTYGLTIRELVVLLSTEGLMGFDRLADIINQLSGNILNISTGTVYEYASEFSDLTLPTYFKIMENLKESPVLATDTTSFKVNGIKNNIRNHSTKNLVWYFPQSTKKKKELFENPLLNSYKGILLHDHESSLYSLDCDQAECNIHLFRALINIKELTQHKWPDKLINLLRKYDHRRKIYFQEEKKKFNHKDLENFETEFRGIIELARKENKQIKEKKIKKKERTLINRIEKYKSAHTLFLYNFDVDFTNNISERDLRIVVRKRKMIGTFRSFRGLEIYCTTLTIVESAKKQKIPVLNVIKNLYQQSSELWAFFILKFCFYYLLYLLPNKTKNI